MLKLLTILIGIGIATGAVAQKISNAEQAAINASPEQVASMVSVKNDAMETSIEVSTEPFYQRREGLLKIVNNDKFLRAFIDKKTLNTSYQVYVWTSYLGSWQNINRANLQTADGPVPAELHKVAAQVEGCSRYGCSQREDVAIDVPEEVLRWASAGAKAGANEDWLVRLGTQAGSAGDIPFLKTEVAGLLIAVERAKAQIAH